MRGRIADDALVTPENWDVALDRLLDDLGLPDATAVEARPAGAAQP
ncbi:MAG: hypothetical protein AAFX76_09895 [Planctomycetota bacterium]